MSVQISYAPLDHSSGVMAWLGAGEEEQGKQGTITSPPNFRLSKKFLSDNFISKIQNLRLKIFHLGEIWSKIET